MSIQQDTATIDVVEAHQQFDDGGLSGTGMTHNCNLLTRLDAGREIVDDLGLGGVAKADSVKSHTSLDTLSTDPFCHRGFWNLFFFLKECKDTFCGSHGLLQDIGDLGYLDNRLLEVAQVLDESLDIANGDVAVYCQIASHNAADNIAKIAYQVHYRHHQSAQEA